MNSRSMVVPTFLVTFLCTTAAFACTPYRQINLDVSPFATPDRIAFSANEWGELAVDVAIVVKDKATSLEIPGTKSSVEGSTVTIFTPDEPLTVGGEYVVEFAMPLGDNAVTGFEVEIIEEASSASITSVTGRIQRDEVNGTCCVVDNECIEDGCGGGCSTCWPGGYEYRPAVVVEVAASRVPVIIDTFIYEEGKESAEEKRTIRKLSFQQAILDTELRRESQAGVCVHTVIRDLDNAILLDSRDCVASDAFPTFEREIPDFPEKVAECASPPGNIEDINWKRYGSQNPSGASDGGCSTTGDSHSEFGIFFLLAMLGVSRRRR